MSRKSLITLSIGLLAFAVIFVVYTKLLSSQFEGPRISIRERSLDLGNGKPNEEMQGELVIQNTGSKPLEYNIVTSCGCTSLTPRKGTLEVGKSQIANVVLKLPEYAKSEKAVRIIVHSNDPDQPQVNCSASARCPAPFNVMPSYLSYGNMTNSELLKSLKTIRIESPEDRAVNLDDLRIKQGPDYIKLERKESSSTGVTFDIQVCQKLNPGDYFDSLEFSLNGSDEVMKVPINFKVVEPVTLIPSTVHLRRVSKSDEKKWASSTVILSSRTFPIPSQKLQLSGTDVQKIFSIQEVGEAPENRKLFRIVSTDKKLKAENFNLKLIVPGYEKEIPFILSVHE